MVAADGHLEIVDRAGGVTWKTAPRAGRFGEVSLNDNGKKSTVGLEKPTVKAGAGGVDLVFAPAAGCAVTVQIRATDDTLAFSYSVTGNVQVERIRLLDSLSLSGADYALIPARLGLLVPANSGLAFTQSFDTSAYEGCHMTMTGLVHDGAAALVTWADPYTSVELKNDKQTLAASLLLRKSANAFKIRFLGKGDWNTIAAAYRGQVSRVTLDQKIAANKERAKLIGASNFKLWSMLNRRMNDESTKEEAVNVNWTFAEAAQVARHLHDDLKMEKVLFTMGGWIHRGYDNQHPDVLPAAPECGGDAELAKCAREVMGLGYLFCLHDNFQDIYKDSPSWDEKWMQRNPDGSLAKGGKWAGGRAYVTCAKMAVELARRPQNLPAVKKLTDANSYFIDTTYAAGLQECFSKDHPLTRADDLREKINLSDYARQVFGVFGSECGREWAIPHSDFFEGITGVSGGYYHNANLITSTGGIVVPLFELVYRDTMAMYGKYGYDIRSAAQYVLHHISIARPLNYHNVPAHLYWTKQAEERTVVKAAAKVVDFKQTAPRQFSLAYQWNVSGKVELDWKVFVHFVAAKKIAFQGDYEPRPATSQWSGELKQGPFMVRVPQDAAGVYEAYVGMWRENARATLPGSDRDHRVLLGRVKVTGEKIEFEPASAPAPSAEGDLAMYVRADNGWAAGMHPYDRFLKNTHEVLSPLNEVTARLAMSRYEFVTPDKLVRRTTFGDGVGAVVVTTNFSGQAYQMVSKQGGEVVLPPLGFLVESPTFTAFCATRWAGVDFETPALFTIRTTGAGIRVFHGFGGAKLRWGGKELQVEREVVLK